MKKVRYALGAAGIAPVLGLAPLAIAATAHPAPIHPATNAKAVANAKAVRGAKVVTLYATSPTSPASPVSPNNTCAGSRAKSGHSSGSGLGPYFTVGAWYAPHATMTCIGTIWVSHAWPGAEVNVNVTNHWGTFCHKSDEANGSGVVVVHCDHSFRQRSLAVSAKSFYAHFRITIPS
jgi:hypothetical protein